MQKHLCLAYSTVLINVQLNWIMVGSEIGKYIEIIYAICG